MKIGLVGCTKSKLDHRAAARDLYAPSAMFRARVAYVERTCDEWLILTAKHGLVGPDDELDPYDVTLVSAGTKRKHEWARGVVAELQRRSGDLRGTSFEIHAGRDYWGFGLADDLLHAGAGVAIPAAGLSQGRQLQFYGLAGQDLEQGEEELEEERRTRRAERFIWREGDIKWIVKPGSPQQKANRKYAPLHNLLSRTDRLIVRVGFVELEELLGVGLPASARNHRSWWANTPSNYHAKAWLDPGWRVDDVNLTAERVTFRKGQ